MLLPVVKLKTPRNSRHPWIYKKMTQAPKGIELLPGSLVEVRDKGGAFVGRAFYHPENTIALRLLTEDRNEAIDERFVHSRLEYAKTLRESILHLNQHGDSYRLVHAEADLLPGLVIDKFGDVLVIEPYVAGWLHLMDWLADSLRALYPKAQVAVRADARVEAKENISFAKAEKRYPAPPHTDITENGIRYRVDFATGHKTGFFLDQRDNRARIAALSAGRSVLDLCCYSGGFALSAWKGGAASVEAVDLDEKALAVARTNAQLNQAGAIKFIHQDAFDTLRERQSSGKRYGLLILDPPKLANGQEEVEKGLKSYYDLNRAAVTAVKRGGLFVTCSCSGAVAEERWRQIVRKAAADAGVGLTIFHTAGPGNDHPVSGDFPQGRYLKVMFARID